MAKRSEDWSGDDGRNKEVDARARTRGCIGDGRGEYLGMAQIRRPTRGAIGDIRSVFDR